MNSSNDFDSYNGYLPVVESVIEAYSKRAMECEWNNWRWGLVGRPADARIAAEEAEDCHMVAGEIDSQSEQGMVLYTDALKEFIDIEQGRKQATGMFVYLVEEKEELLGLREPDHYHGY